MDNVGAALSMALTSQESNSADLEKISKLEAENAILKANAQGGDALQGTIDDLAARKGQLESENRKMSLEVLTLQNELKKAKQKSVKDTTDVAIEQLAVAERDLKKYKAKAEALGQELKATQEDLIQLKKTQSLIGLDQKQMYCVACQLV